MATHSSILAWTEEPGGSWRHRVKTRLKRLSTAQHIPKRSNNPLVVKKKSENLVVYI